jgi:hypothetical protein
MIRATQAKEGTMRKPRFAAAIPNLETMGYPAQEYYMLRMRPDLSIQK